MISIVATSLLLMCMYCLELWFITSFIAQIASIFRFLMIWRDLSGNDLDPQQWGWKREGNMLVPVMTDLTPAPENLLKFVRCKCKLSSRNPCGTNACSCRKNGLKCVSACGDCRGEGCYNSEDASIEENDVDILNY